MTNDTSTTPSPAMNAASQPRLTIGEAAKAVGAWENSMGNVCFGTWEALKVFAMKMQRDLALAHVASHPECAAPAGQGSASLSEADRARAELVAMPIGEVVKMVQGSATLDQKIDAVMAVPDDQLDDHLRAIGLDPDKCEQDGRRALEGAIAKLSGDQGSATSGEGVEELLGQYWDLAYSEGKSGNHDGNKANAVLSKLRAALAAKAEQANPADALIEAARKLVKARGRYHTEQNYKAMMEEVAKYDALVVALGKLDAEQASTPVPRVGGHDDLEKLRADLAWHKESLKRHSEKLAAVWDCLAKMISEHTGKPCSNEPFEDLAKLFAAPVAERAAAPASVPEGYVLVPKVLRQPMDEAMDSAKQIGNSNQHLWDCALAAAPEVAQPAAQAERAAPSEHLLRLEIEKLKRELAEALKPIAALPELPDYALGYGSTWSGSTDHYYTARQMRDYGAKCLVWGERLATPAPTAGESSPTVATFGAMDIKDMSQARRVVTQLRQRLYDITQQQAAGESSARPDACNSALRAEPAGFDKDARVEEIGEVAELYGRLLAHKQRVHAEKGRDRGTEYYIADGIRWAIGELDRRGRAQGGMHENKDGESKVFCATQGRKEGKPCAD